MSLHPSHLKDRVNVRLAISLHEGLCVRDPHTDILTLAQMDAHNVHHAQKRKMLDEIRAFANRYRPYILSCASRASQELSDANRQALFILDVCRQGVVFQHTWKKRLEMVPTGMEIVDFDECMALAAIHVFETRPPPGDELANEVVLRKAA